MSPSMLQMIGSFQLAYMGVTERSAFLRRLYWALVASALFAVEAASLEEMLDLARGDAEKLSRLWAGDFADAGGFEGANMSQRG